jgi:hypothetical protein
VQSSSVVGLLDVPSAAVPFAAHQRAERYFAAPV